MTVVIGTAGHIDHGKTTLLRALTGIDADRLPEERRRGMTIDVGYAHLALPDGSELDFVDVPGHDRLVGNMLVGAGEIDAALLVVAADDGPRAQTIEHLELLDALAIRAGLAVITKIDAVAPDRVADVAAETKALLARTSLAGATVVAVSAQDRRGLDELLEALALVRDRVLADRPPETGPRLAVDRVFSVRGRGTVVTGTLRGGRLRRGESLRLVPGQRSAAPRVREIQVHGRTVDEAGPGRAAANLSIGDGAGIERGSVLTGDPAVAASHRLLVALRPAVALGGRSSVTGLPADRARIQLHLGTARVTGALGRAARDSVELATGEMTAILRLDVAIAVGPGDRFVVRRPSPGGTVAGGRVLDLDPPRGISRKRSSPARLAALAAAPARSEAWHEARLDLHGSLAPDGPAPPRLAGDVAAWLDEEVVGAVTERDRQLADVIETMGRRLRRQVTLDAGPARRAASAAVDRLVAAGRIGREGGLLSDPGRARVDIPAATLAAMERLEAALRVAAPPPLAEAARAAGCPPEGIRALTATGRIVVLDDGVAYASDAFDELRDRALAMAALGPLTPAAFRDATGTSRRYVMAILEELDRRAILRRTPAGHVPGPRATVAARTLG